MPYEPWTLERAKALAEGRECQWWFVASESECDQLLAWPDLPDAIRQQLVSLQRWKDEPVIPTTKRRTA